jgi:hypothetical protein
MDFKLSTLSMRCILRNPDPWEWFTEDLEARRGILSRPEEVGRNRRCDSLHLFRYEERCAGIMEKGVTHLVKAGMKVLEERKKSVMVGELSQEIRMR